MSDNFKFGVGLGVFTLIVAGVVGTILATTGVPLVYYSMKTNKPVYIEVRGEKTMVMSGTRIPLRHERVWVP